MGVSHEWRSDGGLIVTFGGDIGAIDLMRNAETIFRGDRILPVRFVITSFDDSMRININESDVVEYASLEKDLLNMRGVARTVRLAYVTKRDDVEKMINIFVANHRIGTFIYKIFDTFGEAEQWAMCGEP